MRVLLVIATIALVACLGISYGVYHEYTKARTYNSDTLFVQKGMGGRAIAQEIKSQTETYPLVTLMLMKLAITNPIHAGEYDLSDSPSFKTLFDRLNTQTTIKRSVTVPEGLTVYQVIELMKRNDHITDDCPDYKAMTEGSLLPETYGFIRGETCTSLLTRMGNAMTTILDELWDKRDDSLPYKNKEDALIMASIIEKETGVASERARVAGVFVNRLNIGMPLQSDPTTIYALTDGTGEMERELYRSDWKLAHPFNTYFIPALPPAPIANPGKESIYAALHPEPHGYFYFMATGTGGHDFAKTLDEHNRNVHK